MNTINEGRTMTVHKAVLIDKTIQELAIPQGAELIHFAQQGTELCVWFWCDPRAPIVLRRVALVGMGNPAPNMKGARHVGSVLLHNGQLVFHLFEMLASR